MTTASALRAETFREIKRLRSYIAFLGATWFASGQARNDAIERAVARLRSLRAALKDAS